MKRASRVAVATTLAILLTFSMPATALAELAGAVLNVSAQTEEISVSQAEDGYIWHYKVVDGKVFIVGFEEAPVEPEVPEEPENPEDPENPENPDNPNNPDNPDNPADPGGTGSQEDTASQGGSVGQGEQNEPEGGAGSETPGGSESAETPSGTEGTETAEPAENAGGVLESQDGEGGEEGEGDEPLYITIPDKILRADEEAYTDVYGVSEYEVGGKGSWSGVAGITFSAGIRAIDEDAFYGYESLKTASFAYGSQLASLGTRAFKESGLTSIELPSSVASVPAEAFAGCADLVSFSFRGSGPTTAKPFGESVFQGCVRLASAQIPANTSEIPANLFNGCSSLANVSLGSSVTAIGKGAFSGCSALATISLSEGLESIGGDAFLASGLNGTVTIPSTTKRIGDYAFKDCSRLDGVVFSGAAADGQADTYKLQTLGIQAFCNCTELASVTFPSGTAGNFQYIDDEAFYGTALASIAIPASVKEIGEGSFAECVRLSTVTGCAGLEQIDAHAFANTAVSSLAQSVYENVKLIHKEAFKGSAGDAYLEANHASFGLDDEGAVYFRNNAYVQLSGSMNYKYAQELLDNLNASRLDAGVEPLAMDDELLEAAMHRAKELPVYYESTRPNGLGCATLASKLVLSGDDKNGVQLRTMVNETPTTAYNSFVSGASKEILNGDYRSAGVGCALVSGTYYWLVLLCKEDAVVPQSADENGSVAPLGKEAFTQRVGLSSDFTKALPDMQKKELLIKPASNATAWKAGQQVQLEYQYKGAVVDLPSTVRFSSSDPSVATVSPSGLVEFWKGGTVSIRAVIDGLSNSYITSYVFDVAALKSLGGATVSGLVKKTYTGKAQTQSGIVVTASDGVQLTEGTDYVVSSYEDNVNAGTAKLYIKGVNDYGGTAYVTFTIVKAKQTMTLSRVAKTVTAKKKKTVSAVKVKSAKGTVTYANVSKAKASKKLKVNKTTGKVKVPAGMKPGTYKITVQAKVDGKVKGLQNYEAATKKVSLKIRVR